MLFSTVRRDTLRSSPTGSSGPEGFSRLAGRSQPCELVNSPSELRGTGDLGVRLAELSISKPPQPGAVAQGNRGPGMADGL